jgi:hypothetical protein
VPVAHQRLASRGLVPRPMQRRLEYGDLFSGLLCRLEAASSACAIVNASPASASPPARSPVAVYPIGPRVGAVPCLDPVSALLVTERVQPSATGLGSCASSNSFALVHSRPRSAADYATQELDAKSNVCEHISLIAFGHLFLRQARDRRRDCPRPPPTPRPGRRLRCCRFRPNPCAASPSATRANAENRRPCPISVKR